MMTLTTHRDLTSMYVALVSVFLSAWCLYWDNVVNTDAIHYLVASNTYLQEDLATVLTFENWPFYSILIAIVHSISGISLENSAYLLNTLFYALLCVSFVLLVAELTDNKRIIVIAAILVLAHPKLNGYRDYIVKDVGYWGFFFTSILCFYRYIKHRHKLSLFLWPIFMLLAALFRIEGMVFLVLMPLVFLVFMDESLVSRIKSVLSSGWLVIAGVLMVLVLSIFTDHLNLGRLTRDPARYLDYFTTQLSGKFDAKADVLATGVFNKYSDEYAWITLYLAIATMLVLEIAKGITPLYLIGLAYGRYQGKLLLENKFRVLWTSLIGINCLVLLVFISRHFFLAGRYTIAIGLIFCLILPFYIDRIISAMKSGNLTRRKKAGVVFVIIIFVYTSLDGIISISPSKDYVRNASDWVSKNVDLDNSNIFYSNNILAYYSGSAIRKNVSPHEYRFQKYKWEKQRMNMESYDWKQYDYLVIEIPGKDKRTDTRLGTVIGSSPVKKFENKRGDHVSIYKIDK